MTLAGMLNSAVKVQVFTGETYQSAVRQLQCSRLFGKHCTPMIRPDIITKTLELKGEEQNCSFRCHLMSLHSEIPSLQVQDKHDKYTGCIYQGFER